MESRKKDIAVVLGTRPEIIKLAPILDLLGQRALLIHTGQHYDSSMSGKQFEDLRLRPPDILMQGIGGQSQGHQIGRAMSQLTEIFKKQSPKAVIVQGDTNSVSAAAQAARYTGVAAIHVEAGLRSRDRSMPEEINRLVAAAVVDIHCAPTLQSEANLRAEGIPAGVIALTGNTIVEATFRSLRDSASVPPPVKIAPGGYCLVTIHRPENTNTAEALLRILLELKRLPWPVVILEHPRMREAIDRFALRSLLEGFTVIDPQPYGMFLRLAKDARVIVTDSGGIQEEATILRTPLVVVRRSTERPESVETGWSLLVRPAESISQGAVEIVERIDRKQPKLEIPYGDGRASERVVEIARNVANGVAAADAVSIAMKLGPEKGSA